MRSTFNRREHSLFQSSDFWRANHKNISRGWCSLRCWRIKLAAATNDLAFTKLPTPVHINGHHPRSNNYYALLLVEELEYS